MNATLLGNANSLLALGRPRDALLYYERYLATDPSSAEAWHNRGVALAQTKRFTEALSCYDRALTLCPGSAQTWNARGNVLVEEERYDEAPAAFDKALELDKDFPYAAGYRLLSKLWCCDWRDLNERRAEIAAGLAAEKRIIQPFGALMISREPRELLDAARIWLAGRHGAPQALWRGESYCHDRLRIAYVSGDFRDHPVAHLLVGALEHHDRERFETIGISFGADDGSAIRGRVLKAFERTIAARGMTDYQAAAAMREMEVDVAIDLMGLTSGCRTGIFFHRPAPVQVNYLGYPGTLASKHFDYLIADRVAIPEAEREYYSERIAYLSGTYMPTDSRRPVSATRWSRAGAGLPESGFIFCSFNNACKFSPEIFAIWMRLLKSVEGSVLWLAEPNAAAKDNLGREAKAADVDPSRLFFAPRLPSQGEHLARLALGDLFLDTLPCNAHTTACDALWAGLPLLTCKGSSFPGRIAASLLQAIGLPELITGSLCEYERVAMEIASNGDRLRALREKLARNLKTAALFDTAKFTRNLEAAFDAMTERAR
jgi:protein O-GlcNAc transferase